MLSGSSSRVLARATFKRMVFFVMQLYGRVVWTASNRLQVDMRTDGKVWMDISISMRRDRSASVARSHGDGRVL